MLSALEAGTPSFAASRTNCPPSEVGRLRATGNFVGTLVRFSAGTEIYGQNEPAEHVHKVLSGTVITYRVLEDGRRQIGSFYAAGDVFGLEFDDAYTYAAQTINASEILLIKRKSLISRALQDNALARELWMVTARDLERARNHMILLKKTAEERVAAFLLQMAARTDAGLEFDLPMTRQDMADYLGLTIETVSRTLTQLANKAAIELSTSRHIVIRNRATLKRLNS
jgi:CRP-like cAMP-binding protein